jgi:hypothetical protein
MNKQTAIILSGTVAIAAIVFAVASNQKIKKKRERQK